MTGDGKLVFFVHWDSLIAKPGWLAPLLSLLTEDLPNTVYDLSLDMCNQGSGQTRIPAI